MIQLLVQMGYLRHRVPGEFRLGLTLIEFGFTALNQDPLLVVARESLEALAERTQDTILLSLEDGESVLYLHNVPGARDGAAIAHRRSDAVDSDWRREGTANRAGVTLATPVLGGEYRRRFIGGGIVRQTYTRYGTSFDMEEDEPEIRLRGCTDSRRERGDRRRHFGVGHSPVHAEGSNAGADAGDEGCRE